MAQNTAPSVEETLAYEAEQRPRAGLASILSGVTILLGGIFAASVFRDFPPVYLLDGLRDAAGQQLQDGRTGLRTAQLQYYDDKATNLIATGAMQAFGTLLIVVVLGYLYRAAKARRPDVPFYALVAAIAGAVMNAVGVLVVQIAVAVKAGDFVSAGDFTTAAADDVLQGGVLVAAQLIQQLGIFGLALGFVIISLQAMRVGLLTRFMGILGIITGALFILPLGGGLPIVQCFWLIALGVMILGRWPGGMPPAWQTGRAEPWPSQQEIREQRERARREAAGEPTPAGSVALDEDDDAPTGTPHPSSKKRKKKRR